METPIERTEQAAVSGRPMLPSALPTSASETPARPASRPLMPMRGVMSLLSVDDHVAIKLIECGELEFAWNVALDPQRAKCKELRVFPPCIAAYMRGERFVMTPDEVMAMILPPVETMPSKQVGMALNISDQHLVNLSQKRLIKMARQGTTGPCNPSRYYTDSIAEFLKARRYP